MSKEAPQPWHTGYKEWRQWQRIARKQCHPITVAEQDALDKRKEMETLYYDTLHAIGKEYPSFTKLRKQSKEPNSISYERLLEMNMQFMMDRANKAIRWQKRPK